jgi:hypothetical protein
MPMARNRRSAGTPRLSEDLAIAILIRMSVDPIRRRYSIDITAKLVR